MFNVAMLQISSFGLGQIANVEKGIEFCYKARDLGADIILFPEMWNIGYTLFDPENPNMTIKSWESEAIDINSGFIKQFQETAKELEVAIALTYLEKHSPKPRNTVSVINRFGEIILNYSKVHTCDFGLEACCNSGDEFHVTVLDTKNGKVKIGIMICFDREFPESARLLMLKEAEIILVPNSCELDQNRIAQIKSRAFENMVGIAVANYPAPKDNGHSIAVDGIAFDEQGKSRNMVLGEGDEKEDIIVASFDLERLRKYREEEVWGKKYRKPSVYKTICETAK